MTTHRYTAESWDEFVHDLRTRKINWCEGGSEDIDRAGWSGCRDWNAALDYAIKGHAVARAAIDSVTLKVTSSPEPLWDTAPVGAFHVSRPMLQGFPKTCSPCPISRRPCSRLLCGSWSTCLPLQPWMLITLSIAVLRL